MGAPIKYELECAHCGSVFTLEGALARQVRCPICGGSLTVAVAVPVVPPTAPPTAPSVAVGDWGSDHSATEPISVTEPALPPPLLPPVPLPPPPPRAPGMPSRPIPAAYIPSAPRPRRRPKPFPIASDPEPAPSPSAEPIPAFAPFAPSLPELHDLGPESRAEHLHPPWPTVRSGLRLARNAAYVSLPLYGLLLCAALVVLPIASASERRDVHSVMLVLTLIQVVPLVVHTIGQIICTATPNTHGGRMAAVSTVLLGLSALFTVGVLAPGFEIFVGVICCLLLCLSCGSWLRFLSRLGQRLDDRTLIVAAYSYTSWFWIGLILTVFLSGVAVVVDPEAAAFGPGRKNEPVTWCIRAGVGAIGLLLILWYASLLRTASHAIATRGPVRPKS